MANKRPRHTPFQKGQRVIIVNPDSVSTHNGWVVGRTGTVRALVERLPAVPMYELEEAYRLSGEGVREYLCFTVYELEALEPLDLLP